MPETCDNRLTGEFVKQCGYKPKEGITKKWYFNWDDIDREATQLANRGTKITLLVLKADKKIFKVEGAEKGLKSKHSLAILDFSNGYVHTDSLTILYHGEKERQRIQELVDGGRIGSINQKLDGGLNGELTFEIFGYESGMKITEDNYDSAANSGAVSIACATQKGEEESTGKKLFLLEAGVSATEAWIKTNTYVPA
jgi:hypothetical protein